MPIGLETGLLIPVCYMCICEVLRKKPSEQFLIIFGGIGFILNAYLGGWGHLLSIEKSLISSIVDIAIAFILYLPYKSFYPQKWLLFYYLATIALWLNPILFIQYYFYTALVCGLLSFLLLVREYQIYGSTMSILKYWKKRKNTEGNSGIYAPYYTASLFGFLGVYIQIGMQR